IPAVHLSKFALKLGSPDSIRFGKIRFCIDRILLLHQAPEVLMAHHHRVNYSNFVKGIVILTKYSHTLSGFNRHVATGRINVAREDLQKSGFACTVCSDYAIAVAGGKLDIYLVKQHTFSELKRQIISSDH